MPPPDSRERLSGIAAALACPMTTAQSDRLLAYLDLLAKWNKVYNLTAIRDPSQMLTQHLADSLAVISPLRRHLGERSATVLDVGSGGGLPGVVIAVMLPQCQVTCVDAVAKKASFIRQTAGELRLPNLRAVHARVEQMDAEGFDVITSRAFASLDDFARLTVKRLAPDGIWLAMKGRPPDDEMAALGASVKVFHVEQLSVPGLDGERCLVWMRPVG